ncbi:alcohol dehydrogenase class-3-like [Frankliniella occidentalis]|uniref:Alcohol dehydrogenase class-3-like n=1 Tax=Frankliniella occidentalis TaxID=133901 RepID=A0A6J1TE63_FRAOC|nr:alcohol dehydrogenase class-3-like [Frankliniella occidentalis]
MSTAGKAITCRAAVCWEPNQPLSVEEVVVEPPEEGEVRVKLLSASICRTDFCCLKGFTIKKFYAGGWPVIPGHEGVGVVESVGPKVTSVQQGDHVIPSFGAQCNKCSLCQSSRTNMCLLSNDRAVLPAGVTRVKAKGQMLYQLASLGTFAEYSVMAETSLARVNKSVPTAPLSVMGCCVPTGMGTALNEAKVTPGSVCAVWGLGGVGLSIVLGCKMAGASTIVGVEIHPEKEANARKFGCTDFIDSKSLDKPVSEYLAERFGGGCDFTFESTGSTKAMAEAFESVRDGGGHCVVVGGVPEGQNLSIYPGHLLNGRALTGCLFGGYRFRNDLPSLVEMIAEGKIPVDDYITGSFKLAEINKAMDTMRSANGIRITITFD